MSGSDWSLFAFFTVLAVGSCLVLGAGIVDFYIRVAWRNERSLFRRWGVEQDIFSIESAWRFGPWLAIMGAGSAYLSYIFIALVGFVFGGATDFNLDGEYFDRSVSVLCMALIVGGFWRAYRAYTLNEKARRLERLPPYFLQTVGTSELVATYDSLAQAPSMFWEEFSTLGDFEVTREASRRYREMASHYRALRSLNYVRWGIIAAGLIPLVLFLLERIWGGNFSQP